MHIGVLIFGVFYILYGIFGLFGIQNISEKYRNRTWTKRYTRLCGVYDLLLGVPWTIAWLVLRNAALRLPQLISLFVALALPPLILSIALDVKYRRLARREDGGHFGTEESP